jgi:rhodanese-related sulfurtransferase
MNWTTVSIVVAVIAVIFILKRAGQISSQDALTHLKNGALVIDVRSPGEFSSGHLSKAVNIPMEQLESVLPKLVKGKDEVLLLHCLSGTRSGMAKSKLKSLGYTNVFNLGSFARARKIVGNQEG